MKKKWWHYAVAFVAGGFLLAPLVGALKGLTGR